MEGPHGKRWSQGYSPLAGKIYGEAKNCGILLNVLEITIGVAEASAEFDGR
jgi:hypothetical protein